MKWSLVKLPPHTEFILLQIFLPIAFLWRSLLIEAAKCSQPSSTQQIHDFPLPYYLTPITDDPYKTICDQNRIATLM